MAVMAFPGSSAGKESACNEGDLGLIPRLGRSPEEGNGYSLQYSGLENPMDYYIDYGVTKSRTRLSTLHIYALTPSLFIWIFCVLKVTDILPGF